ncbi:deoxyribose-phosphate aldolase [Chromohalobacter canadensis]|uniref:Deoxyribose-phosphate aldolase n=2 Tax=Chromohalobacter canadensis TaxID=141389 RepID=A0ABZ0Y7T2_9GAMM|nr:deoxyribose-phosphate aldolase [Chromohalobacter canadensis]MCK0769806.1 deoxyribose-phosphate aldolase [Chromohalobacter canadensis]WQH08114.1 deoxyribose-phosphate aldolase [Chromohalobacter canadensis]
MTDLKPIARQALALMDLTSLNDDDDSARIQTLCRRANTPVGYPAALCLYPAFIEDAQRELDALGLTRRIRIATVTNFPEGASNAERAARETRRAVAAGADEVDVVFPYRALLDGAPDVGRLLVEACREACGGATLKVILETGELQDPALIRQAADIAIAAGADFIKTSTGKVAVNATLESAEIMLEAIRDSGRDVGFKAAGGIRTTEDAKAYLELAARIMGDDWATPVHFRFGASGLLDALLATLEVGDTKAPQDGY